MAADDEFQLSSDREEEEEDGGGGSCCYFSDQYVDDDVNEETVLEGLEDGGKEDCHWSVSSVITKESLLAAQKEDLRKVMELLVISEQHARTLLIHYRWDVERIFELLEQKEKERLFSEAGVTIIESKVIDSSGSTSMHLCNICFENVSSNTVTEMDCGHCYCNDCWTENFIVKINDGQSGRIRCMAPTCNAVCDEAIVGNLVSARHPDIAD